MVRASHPMLDRRGSAEGAMLRGQGRRLYREGVMKALRGKKQG